MTIGDSICRHRKSLGLSQEMLGKKLLVSRQTISLWEKNQTVPTIDNLIRLKEIFGVSIDDIVCGGDTTEKMKTNSSSLDTVCGALAYAMGVEPPRAAAEKNWELSNYIDKIFDGEKADRVVIYNNAAIAQWIYKKYGDYFKGTKSRSDIEIFLSAVMPSVTPVGLATMYTGVRPEVHGIRKYEKPVISLETLFDALIAAGKKPALVSYRNCSLGRIFLERNMDYYNFAKGGISEVNAKTAELILRDEHDFIVFFNGDYDSVMHKNGPESPRALADLRVSDHVFSFISDIIKNNWQHHNTLVGFATDHGCHEIDGGCGSHGLDMLEDINIVHLYKGYPKSK